MPYSDPEKQKAYRREWYRRRYAQDSEFREDEKDRAAEGYEENKEYRKAVMRRYTKAWRKRKSEQNDAGQSSQGSDA